MQELQHDLTAKGVVFLLVNSVSATHPSPALAPENRHGAWVTHPARAL
jgi:hypothetical protein